MAGRHSGSGTALLVVGTTCVVLGAVFGGDRMVHSASTSSTTDPSSLPSSSKVVFQQPEAFDGTVRVASTACREVAGATDVARLVVTDASGREVARGSSAVVGSSPVQLTAGRGLAAGRYTATVSCISDGELVGDTFSTTADVYAAGTRPSAMPVTGD